MPARNFLAAITIFVVLAMTHGRAALAAIVCVDPTAPGCESTIQAAVDLVTGADTVVIAKGRYDENVVVPPGLDGLTIEGKGAVIDADLPNTGVGLTIGSNNVTVSDLTVRNGQTYGIHVTPGTVVGSAFSGVTVLSSGSSCLRLEGNGHSVNKATLDGCALDGVEGSGNDISVTESKISRIGNSGIVLTGDSAVIEKNKLSLIDDEAIDVTGDDARVVGNRIDGTSGHAIELSGNDFIISDNKAKIIDQSLVQLQCSSCTGGLVSGNSLGASTRDEGISVQSAGGLVVEENSIKSSDDEGIRVVGDGVTIRNNTVSKSGSDAPCYDISGVGNTVTGNQASDCMKGGFIIDGDDAVVTGNTATDTLEDGFDLGSGDGAEVSGNRATDNLGMGFAVSSGVTNASIDGNTASGNREDYCDAGTGTVVGSNSFTSTFDPMGGDCPVDK